MVISSGDLLALVVGEAHVAIGEDADELSGARGRSPLDHRDAGDAIALHQSERVGERRVGGDGHRVHHHAALEFLHPADLLGLLFDGEVLVDHAHAAGLGHGDGEAGLGDGVHGGGDQRNAELDGPREAGAGVDLAGKDVGRPWHKENVVEGQGFADSGAQFHAGVYQPEGDSARAAAAQATSPPPRGR